jgi:glycosyltransferase involved in cell wall biosynthesis
MKTLFVVNSILGKPGNIGQRPVHVIRRLEARGEETASFSRAHHGGLGLGRGHFSLGPFGQLLRGFNAIRIFGFKGFNSKKAEQRLFRWGFYVAYWALLRARARGAAVHTTETDPRLLRFLLRRGHRIILDLPILPSSFVRHLVDSNPGTDLGLTYFPEIEADERSALDLADHVVVPSGFVRAELERIGYGAKPITVIPFGIDRLEARGSGKRPIPGPGGLQFCFAGNISPRKGIRFLLDAWEDPAFSGSTLHLCGRVYPEIRREIDARRPRNVVLAGFVDTAKYFQLCDAYVFPSLMEGSSKSIYEAMAAGLACIVTPNSGSVIRDGVNGLIVPAASTDALRAAMKTLLADGARVRALGENARRDVADFTWERYADRCISVFGSAHGPGL